MRATCAPLRALLSLLLLLTLLPVLAPTGAVATAASDPLYGVPPAEIRVCDRNGELVAQVPFDQYVKTVLPREFPSNWPMAALEAGALAVKSYAWYHVRHPWRPGCHLSDTTRHQLYCPDCHNEPTERSDRAVEATWHVRFEDAGRGDVAYAQYCSACSGFPEGRHMDQWEAYDKAAAGWTTGELIAHFYRDMPPRLVDWRDGLGLAFDGGGPYAFDDGEHRLVPTATVAGVPPDDPRARGHLFASCRYDGEPGVHHLDDAVVHEADGRATVVFDDGSPVRGCAEDEVVLVGRLTVNGWTAAETTAQAWRPWTSAEPRPVDRIAETNDPVTGSVAISRELFANVPGRSADVDGSLRTLARAVGDEPSRGEATTAVVARGDRFADALAATGLAGRDGPILFTPGGPDAPLSPQVADELERMLAPGRTVHIVGGPAAVSEAAEADLESRGYRVRRHAGPTRIETAIAVADHLYTHGGDISTVLVARGYPDTSAGWADAVTAGAYAATRRHPILLTGSDRLDERTARWIDAAAERGLVEEAVLLGGPAAVPAQAEARLAATTVHRVAGTSRDATAIAIADRLWSRPGTPEVTAAVVVDAYGDTDWPFALAAAVYSARVGAPQLVTHRLVPRTTTGAWLDARPGLPAVVVGGPEVVRTRIDGDVSGGG